MVENGTMARAIKCRIKWIPFHNTLHVRANSYISTCISQRSIINLQLSLQIQHNAFSLFLTKKLWKSCYKTTLCNPSLHGNTLIVDHSTSVKLNHLNSIKWLSTHVCDLPKVIFVQKYELLRNSSCFPTTKRVEKVRFSWVFFNIKSNFSLHELRLWRRLTHPKICEGCHHHLCTLWSC
jgi:hypothetical protein